MIKNCVVLIKADISNKAVQGNIPKPLNNLSMNALRLRGEMACVEHSHTFGNSDITNHVTNTGL